MEIDPDDSEAVVLCIGELEKLFREGMRDRAADVNKGAD